MIRIAQVFAIVSAACLAQTPSASIVGRVTDPSGSVAPGVVLTVTNVETNIRQTGASNSSGDFTMPYLSPGRYVLAASAPGFQTYQRSEFQLEVNQALRIDIPLSVGTASDTVTVNDVPAALNTETGSRGEVVTQSEIKEMPLAGRSFADLALLTGGVIPRGEGNDGSYSVNGGRADNTGFLLDGMNNTQRRNTSAIMNPPIEGVQEFKMLTSGFAAEYGRYAGGMLSVVTKSGTNKFRGSMYEFLRNDALDATGYFDPGKSKLRRNQFGATVSGPLWLPKLYNGRNRTFFMVTWDSLRLGAGESQRGVVPLPEMLRGDFSRATDAFGRLVRVTDSISRLPFANNQIPASRLDPVAAKLSAYFPAPNLVNGGPFNYVAQGDGTNRFDSFGVRIDHNASAKDRLTLSTFWRPQSDWDPVTAGKSPLPLFGGANRTLELLTYIKYIRIIRPTIFLEASANFSRRTNNEVWPYSADKDWAADSGFRGGISNPVAAGLPYVTVTGYIPLGPNNTIPKIWAFNNYQYTVNTTWISGKHTLKAGADFLRAQYFSRNYGDTRGRAGILGRFSGDAMADFVLGWADSTRRQLDGSGPYHLVSNYSAFLQDDFKVTPALTLNLGVRYDLAKPPREKYGAWAVFLPSLGKVVTAGTGNLSQAEFDQRVSSAGLSPYVVKASEVGLPSTITQADWNNFAPRFGFAWRPFGSTGNVIRGGYGIFFGSSSLYRLDNYADTYPFTITETFNRNSADPTALTVSNPFPTSRRSFAGVSNSYGEQTAKPKSQYTQSWSLAFERQFARDTVVELAFAGSKGTHLPRRYDVNQAGRDASNRTLRPYPFFGSIEMISDGSNSIYNSGQVTVRRRFSKRFFLRGTYTFAKSIDETSNTGGSITYNFGIAQDSRNLKLECGRSDFDIGHTFAGSFIWSPQFTRHWMGRDWQVSGTSTIYSGTPFTPRVANYSYVNGEASRPDRIRKGTLDNPATEAWYDRTAFVPVPLGSYRFGNSGRNILDSPGTIVVNTSLSRRFRLGENSLQLRAEAFNLPNHPNFNVPENNIDISTAGAITRAKNNRNLQLGLRLEF